MLCFINFYRIAADGYIFQYRGVEHRTVPNTIPVVGVVALNGPRLIRRIEGRQDPRQYIKFLSHLSEIMVDWQMEPTLELIPARRFVHDHHPVHKSAAVKCWLSSQNNLKEIPWPPQSGDLMPLEVVWRDLVYDLNRRNIVNNVTLDISCLWHEIKSAWENVVSDLTIGNLINSLPMLCQSILEENQ